MGTLTGLKQSSDADFNARTKEQEALKAELEKAGITAGSGSLNKAIQIIVMTVWTHTPNLAFLMTSLLSLDVRRKAYLYPLRQGALHFCDKGVSDGVSLNVVRDKAGNIEKLVSVDKGELEQFVK